MENAKFSSPRRISGVVGISWNRIISRWIVKDNKKYLGAFQSLEEAKKFRKEYFGAQ